MARATQKRTAALSDQREVDHVEELIDSIARQLAHDSGGEDFVMFERGDGRRLSRIPTFHTELLLPHLDKLRPYRNRDGGALVPVELEREGEKIREAREKRIREFLAEHRADLERYVEGD